MIIESLKHLAVDVEQLKNWEKNPRVGSIEAVARSLEKFGQRKPIVVNKRTNEVIAGNHTIMAAKSLGWKEVAAVWVDDDEATAQAYAIADNRTHDLGAYDEQALAALVEELANTDLILAAGYGEQDIEDLYDTSGYKGDLNINPQYVDPNQAYTPIASLTTGADQPVVERPVAAQLDPDMYMLVKIGAIEIKLSREEGEPLLNVYRAYIEKHGTATGFFLWLVAGRDQA
jgi:hypothetical protein